MINTEDAMNTNLKRTLFWMPRMASILFVVFISLFALDVFGEELGFWRTVGALSLHLIPSILLAIAIVIAWKQEWFGALIFIGWAIWHVLFMQGFPLVAYAIIAGLPLLIGLLFLAGWFWRKQIQPGGKTSRV